MTAISAGPCITARKGEPLTGVNVMTARLIEKTEMNGTPQGRAFAPMLSLQKQNPGSAP
jgi:hypothetical protein